MDRPTSDERGLSITVFVTVVLAALILTVGLVVDGGQKATAVRRAESAAAGAARAAGNAAAGPQVAGRSDPALARAAARAYLDGTPGVDGEIDVADGVLTVRTRTTVPTVFLSAIGISTVSGTGTAEADIVPVGGTG